MRTYFFIALMLAIAFMIISLAFMTLTSYGRANIAGPAGFSLSYLR